MTEEILVAIFYIGLSWLVGLFARWMFGRSVLVWTVLSILFSPVVAFVFANVAGRPPSLAEDMEEREEEERRKTADFEHKAESQCPFCGHPINPATREGLEASAEEPWRISCAQCSRELDGARIDA